MFWKTHILSSAYFCTAFTENVSCKPRMKLRPFLEDEIKNV